MQHTTATASNCTGVNPDPTSDNPDKSPADNSSTVHSERLARGPLGVRGVEESGQRRRSAKTRDMASVRPLSSSVMTDASGIQLATGRRNGQRANGLMRVEAPFSLMTKTRSTLTEDEFAFVSKMYRPKRSYFMGQRSQGQGRAAWVWRGRRELVL